MGLNKSRRLGGDPALPRLLGERLCLDFVNTVEGPLSAHPEDYLQSYADLVRWAGHVGSMSTGVAEVLLGAAARHAGEAAAAFEGALALRAALTRIFRAVARGAGPGAPDLELLRTAYLAALRHAQLALASGHYTWSWPSDGVALERPLWPVARSAVEVLTADDLLRVKQCPGAGDCGWLFYDTSKNGSRRWCSMEGCGSRVKMRQHYARARAAREG